MNRLKELRNNAVHNGHKMRETAIDRGFSMQGLLDENSALRDENRRLINELTNSYKVNAKANLLDIIISEGYVLQSTLDKCIGKLDEIDQLEVKKYYEGENQ